jgi:hypothetical protein
VHLALDAAADAVPDPLPVEIVQERGLAPRVLGPVGLVAVHAREAAEVAPVAGATGVAVRFRRPLRKPMTARKSKETFEDLYRRLEETVAQPEQIVLGAATQRAVAHLFPTEHLGNVQLRGLQGKLPVFRLLTEEISGPGE